MIEIKFLGRGGQGVVLASQLLARACFEEGLYPQSFSIFGGERRGAPVAAFVRVDRKKIYLKCDIDQPDHLVLFDPSFWKDQSIIAQIKPGGSVLVNIGRNGLEGEKPESLTLGSIDALKISLSRGLGAIVNTAVLGAYVRFSGLIRLDTLIRVMRENLPAAVDQNVAAAREAFESLHVESKRSSHLDGD